MSLRLGVSAVLAAATVVGACSKKAGKETTVQNKPLANAELTEIAAQVERGERPRSDLAKYGITVGEPKQISAGEFMRRFAAEQAATQPSGK